MTKRPAVWITGVGVATPLGTSFPEVAEHLLAGQCGIQRITTFDVKDYLVQIAALMGSVPAPPGVDPADFAALDTIEQLHTWCIVQALHDAGYWAHRHDLRIGLVLGLGAEWPRLWELDHFAGGQRLYDPQEDRDAMVARLARRLGLRGPTVAVAAACASGNVALDQARRFVRLGWVDLCLAGACDLGVTPMSLAGFGNLRALSRRNDDPLAASRPFDRDRDGFVMGEGGTIFVLESDASARRRDARVYGELAGCSSSSDAFHMVIPGNNPAFAIRAMQGSLADAGINPDEVDYINAHATGTPVGDTAETRALQAVFGPAIERIPVSSTKSMSGHLLAAASTFEALACLAAIDRQAVPPTINLEHPDPECQLCHVPNQAQPRPVKVAVSNSFGFGGSNVSVVLRQVA